MKYFSLRIIIQQKLEQILPTSVEKLALYRLNSLESVTYRCIFVSPSVGARPPLPQQINCLSWSFQVKLLESGCDLCLGDHSLGIWLQNLTQIVDVYSTLKSDYSYEVISPLFTLQYAHSRCCAVLRLGHQQEIIKLQDLYFTQPIWQWLEPELNFNSTKGDLLLIKPEARALINQMIAIIDALESQDTQNWLKLTTNLAKTFLDFHSRYPLWADKQNLEIIQAYLGLIALTQWLLQYLLNNKLNIPALVEL